MKGDKVRLQNPKTLRWSVTGIVTDVISHQGATRPSSYEIEADADCGGGTFLRNVRFLKLREKQSENIPENADTNQTSDIEPDNSEDEYDRSDDSSEDSGHDNRHTESDHRQSNDDTEEQGALYRRSPRLKNQLRVTYQEAQSTSNGRRSHKGSRKTDSSHDRPSSSVSI